MRCMLTTPKRDLAATPTTGPVVHRFRGLNSYCGRSPQDTVSPSRVAAVRSRIRLDSSIAPDDVAPGPRRAFVRSRYAVGCDRILLGLRVPGVALLG
jgi:hypothetical protein